MKKVKIISIAVALGILVAGGVYYWGNYKKLVPVNNKTAIEDIGNPFEGFKVSSRVYPIVYQISQSNDDLLVVNKKHSLPSEYAPETSTWNGTTLRKNALEAYKKLIQGAKNDGINLTTMSSYRSYTDQEKLFNDYVKRDGQVKAETYSARPGHSEHQMGLAVDVGLPSGACNLETCMANTKEGQWLAMHAHEYGYIIRYPEGKESDTGYQFEPWHIRYLGVDVATGVYESRYTLDEYFGITAGGYVPQATTNL